jgi:hypothetical protein
VEIKIEAKTVTSNEGGFEPHPESYTPRVFAAVMPAPDGTEPEGKVYEILQNGQAIPWPCLPILEGFDYWVLYVEHLADVDMHRAPKPKPEPKKFWAGTNILYDRPRPAFTRIVDVSSTPDPVPQADGDCPNPDVCGCGQTPTWIGEVDGKKYSGLGERVSSQFANPEWIAKQESGDLSHLPEGSH